MEKVTPGTPEQAWCGKSYRCPRGDYSVLIPSTGLRKQLAEQRAAVTCDCHKGDDCPELRS